MREIGIQELKQIQLDILTRVHEFCMANDINYSLSSGTLIGAVRHRGYIPWDDDIDIYMMRPEFERFEHIFSDKHLQIMSLAKDKKCIYPYAKVYDSRTVLKEKVDFCMKDLGVNIDVFIIDSVPEEPFKRKSLFKKNNILDSILLAKTVRINKGRVFSKNCILFVGKVLFSIIPIHWIVVKKNMICMPFNPNASEICNVMAGNGINTCIPKHYMESFIDVEFEGRLFKCMENYDQYLRLCYGDYMQLPPEEKRVSHHSFTAFWK